jgi:hypothetical protein
MLALIALDGLGHRYRIVSSVLMVALMLVVFVVITVQLMRPQLRLREPPPKAEVGLKI